MFGGRCFPFSKPFRFFRVPFCCLSGVVVLLESQSPTLRDRQSPGRFTDEQLWAVLRGSRLGGGEDNQHPLARCFRLWFKLRGKERLPKNTASRRVVDYSVVTWDVICLNCVGSLMVCYLYGYLAVFCSGLGLCDFASHVDRRVCLFFFLLLSLGSWVLAVFDFVC